VTTSHRIITTVSANVGGCKDPSKDAHADLEGYQDALGGFCRNKKAGAAFFWLNASTFSTLPFVLRKGALLNTGKEGRKRGGKGEFVRCFAPDQLFVHSSQSLGYQPSLSLSSPSLESVAPLNQPPSFHPALPSQLLMKISNPTKNLSLILQILSILLQPLNIDQVTIIRV